MSKNISQLITTLRPPPAPFVLPLYLTKNRLRSERYRCMWCKTLSTNNICLCVALPMYINRRDRRDRRDHRFWPWWPPVVKGGQWPIKNVQKQSEFSGFPNFPNLTAVTVFSEFSEFDCGDRHFMPHRKWFSDFAVRAVSRDRSWPVKSGQGWSQKFSGIYQSRFPELHFHFHKFRVVTGKKRSVGTGRDR